MDKDREFSSVEEVTCEIKRLHELNDRLQYELDIKMQELKPISDEIYENRYRIQYMRSLRKRIEKEINK